MSAHVPQQVQEKSEEKIGNVLTGALERTRGLETQLPVQTLLLLVTWLWTSYRSLWFLNLEAGSPRTLETCRNAWKSQPTCTVSIPSKDWRQGVGQGGLAR